MPMPKPLATHDYKPGDAEDTLEFLKRTRNELRVLRKVRVWTDRIQVFDVNGDYFEICGIGYTSDEVRPILDAVHTAYKPESIQNPIEAPYKEFKTGKRHPWAEDRVM
jgi:hypothetical protein